MTASALARRAWKSSRSAGLLSGPERPLIAARPSTLSTMLRARRGLPAGAGRSRQSASAASASASGPGGISLRNELAIHVRREEEGAVPRGRPYFGENSSAAEL